MVGFELYCSIHSIDVHSSPKTKCTRITPRRHCSSANRWPPFIVSPYPIIILNPFPPDISMFLLPIDYIVVCNCSHFELCMMGYKETKSELRRNLSEDEKPTRLGNSRRPSDKYKMQFPETVTIWRPCQTSLIRRSYNSHLQYPLETIPYSGYVEMHFSTRPNMVPLINRFIFIQQNSHGNRDSHLTEREHPIYSSFCPLSC